MTKPSFLQWLVLLLMFVMTVLVGLVDFLTTKKIDTGLIVALFILVVLYNGLESVKESRKRKKLQTKEATKVTLDIIRISNPIIFLWSAQLIVLHNGVQKETKPLLFSQKIYLFGKYPQLFPYIAKAVLTPSQQIKTVTETFYYHAETDSIWLA